MVLKLVKQLSPEVAAKLRASVETEKKFLQLADCQFLTSAYAEHLEGFKPKKGAGLATTVVKELGTFPWLPEGLNFCDKALTFTPAQGEEGKQQSPKNVLAFDCGPHNYATGLTLQLKELTHGTMLWESKTLYTAQSPWFLVFGDGGEEFGKGNILDIAVNFYNQQPLYQKIHRLLLKNKSEYEKSFGQAFVEGLTLLFSAEGPPKKANPLGLTPDYLSTRLVKKVGIKRYQSLGLHYYAQQQGRKLVETGNLLELFLGAKNQLMILIFHPDYEANNPALISETSEEFKQFLETNLEPWLEQRLTLTAFCNAIYEKVKLKLLFENL